MELQKQVIAEIVEGLERCQKRGEHSWSFFVEGNRIKITTGKRFAPIPAIKEILKGVVNNDKKYNVLHQDIEMNSYYDAYFFFQWDESEACQLRMNPWFGGILIRIL